MKTKSRDDVQTVHQLMMVGAVAAGALLFTLFTATLGSAAALAQQEGEHEFRYAVFDVGNLGRQDTFGNSLNNAGIVVGRSSYQQGNAAQHGFVWRQGSIEDLGVLCCYDSLAWGINDAGIIVGQSAGDNNATGYPVYWDTNRNIVTLPLLGGHIANARAINNLGLIVGDSTFEDGNYNSRAVMWENGKITDMGTLGGTQSGAYDVNDAGQVVGVAQIPGDRVHATLWDHGQAIDLGALIDPSLTSRARGINASGTVVGDDIVGFNFYAYMWRNGQAINIHDANTAYTSSASDINDDGFIVGGMALRSNQKTTGFIRDPNTGVMQDLKALCPPDMVRSFVSAQAINNAGQIVVNDYSYDHLAKWSMLLTPVHQTMRLSQPTPRRAGTDNTVTITGCPPNRMIYLFYGFHGGGTIIPSCDLQQAALQINQATVAASALSDEHGTVTLERYVAGTAHGAKMLLQAVEPTTCQQSQLLVTKFR